MSIASPTRLVKTENSLRLFACFFVCLFIYSFIYLFVCCSFIYLFVVHTYFYLCAMQYSTLHVQVATLEQISWINATGTLKWWGREARLARWRLIITAFFVTLLTTGSAKCTERYSLWEPEPERLAWLDQTTLPEQQPEKSCWNPTSQLIDYTKDSILHSWEKSDSTAVCTQQIFAIDTWGDSVKVWTSWSHRKPTEHTCWTLILNLQLFTLPPNAWRLCCLQQ